MGKSHVLVANQRRDQTIRTVAGSFEVPLHQLIMGKVQIDHSLASENVDLDIVEGWICIGRNPVVLDGGDDPGLEFQDTLVNIRDIESFAPEHLGARNRIHSFDSVIQ